MKDRTRDYQGHGIVVRFDPRRCIHAAECVMRLPEVFDPERRPWIEADRAGADAIAETITRCPTGALHFERTGGGPAEQPDAENRIRVTRNGPLHVRGVIELRERDGTIVARDLRLALCRCGASRNRPFCDNSHRAIRFVDRGEVFAGKVGPAGAAGERTLTVTIDPAGPYRLRGPFTVVSADGQVRIEGGETALCRCGASRNKPFCDGSHKQEDLSTS